MLKNTATLATMALLAGLTGPAIAQESAAEGETDATETAAPMADVSADTVVATVGNTDITLGQMIIARNQLPEQYRQLPDDVLFSGVLDQLVQQQVLADTLTTEPSRVTIALENERRSLMAGEVVNEIVANAVTDESLQAAYADVVANVGPMQEYNAAHILVGTEEEAQAVIEQIAAGEDFADIAKEVSTDVGSGANGGDLGWFGAGMMVAPFEDAVVSLDVGEISDPVETQFGWHVIKLNDSRQQTPPELEEIRADLEADVRNKAIEDRLTELLDQADVVLPEDGTFDPSILRNLELLRD